MSKAGKCSVKLPRCLGQEVTFEALGRRFHLRKVGKTSYCLTCPLHSSRARFGGTNQMYQDIESCLLTGVLPGQAGRP